MDHLKDLNPEQSKVVNLTEGPILVLAGPGTGKTHLLSARASHIIKSKKALPENILILTFTNAAAKTMKERLVRLLEGAAYDIETATFHSFANSVILKSEEAVNYIQEKIQITDIERVKLLEYILDHTADIDAIRPFRAPYIYRREIEGRIGELKKEGIPPSDFMNYISALIPDGVLIEEKHIPRLKALAIIYKLYEEYKDGKNAQVFDARGRYDYDDMIIYALQALRQEPELKNTIRKQYTYIMVDEFQDTNGAQMDFLFQLTDTPNPNLCCVGDDDQSIYRFQGASIANFRALKEKFRDLKIVTLKDNYRSTKTMVDSADRIIKALPETERMEVKALIPRGNYKKSAIEFYEFGTGSEELLFLAEKVKKIKTSIEKSPDIPKEGREEPFNNIAILVRKRDDILKIVDTFLRAGIPYATDGKEDMSSEKRVRQIIDLLQLAHFKSISDFSYKDTLLYRVITSDYLCIHLDDVLSFINYVKRKRVEARARKEFSDISLFAEFLRAFPAGGDNKPPDRQAAAHLPIARETKLNDPHALHQASWAIKRLLEGAETKPVHTLLLQYIDDSGLFRYILREYSDNHLLRIRDLRALTSFINMIKESDVNNPAMTLSDFIDEIETRKEHGIPLTGSLVTTTQRGVRILTAHGSKGLEFHTVIIPFCLQNRNWPLKARVNTIPLPAGLFKVKDKKIDKVSMRELQLYDETRLFYVASTRAKSNLIYTASPTESTVKSSYLSRLGLVEKDSARTGEEEILKKSMLVTSKKDSLNATKKILKDTVANLTLNPTSLNNYITCGRKFFYDNVLMLPSMKRQPLIFGNCVHKALEDTYRYFLENDAFPDFDFFKKSFEQELRYQGAEKSIHAACLRQADTLARWFNNEAKTPLKPLGLEKKLVVMIDQNLIFTGKYDRTDLVDEEKKLVRVVDYKTGIPDAHVKRLEAASLDLMSDECEDYLRQLVAYKLLFDRDKDQNLGFRVSEGTLVFVEPAKTNVAKYALRKGEFVNKRVAITESMVTELEGVIKTVWAKIQRLDFDKLPKRDEEKCRNCDYNAICWG